MDDPNTLLEKQRNIIVEINTRTFDKAMAYTNLVTLGGYAGAFTVWTFTRTHLTENATILIALLLGISIAVFVLFEVYKTMRMTSNALKFRELMMEGLPAQEFIQKVVDLEREQDSMFHRVWMRAWAISWYTSVLTALAAIGILFYNFFAILLGCPAWPA